MSNKVFGLQATLTPEIAVPHFIERLCNIFWHSCHETLSFFIFIPMPAWTPSSFEFSFGGIAAETRSSVCVSVCVEQCGDSLRRSVNLPVSAPKSTFKHHWQGSQEVSCVYSQSFSFFCTLHWKIVTGFVPV